MTFLTGNLWRAGAIALAAFAVLFFVQLKIANGKVADLRKDLLIEKQAHEVSKQSVAQLQDDMARIMADALAREADLKRAREQAEKQRAAFAKQRQASDQQIARLRGSVSTLESDCTTPDSLINDASGL